MPTDITMTDTSFNLVRLMHLVSPSLPTGAFACSQGLEWAVEAGWVKTGDDLLSWVTDLITHTWARVDIPVLARMAAACRSGSTHDLTRWCAELLAMRETSELRLEEQQRGQAMAALLQGLAGPLPEEQAQVIAQCQLAGFAKAAVLWDIPIREAATGYLWSWLENQVIAGIKIIPLGQTRGHRILSQMDTTVARAVDLGLSLTDEEIGAASPALAIASSRHETQYTRLYRS